MIHERIKNKMLAIYKRMWTLFIVLMILECARAKHSDVKMRSGNTTVNNLQITAQSNSTVVSNTSLTFKAEIVTNQTRMTFMWFMVDEKNRKPFQRICHLGVSKSQTCVNGHRLLQSECRVDFADTIQTLSGPVRVKVTVIGTTKTVEKDARDPIRFSTPWRIRSTTEKPFYKFTCDREMESSDFYVKWTVRFLNSNKSLPEFVPCCPSHNETHELVGKYFVTDAECKQGGKLCEITIDSSKIRKYAPTNEAYIRCSHPHDDDIGSAYIVLGRQDKVNIQQGMKPIARKYIILLLGIPFGLIFFLSCTCIFLVVLVMRSKRKAMAQDEVVEMASNASLHRLRTPEDREDEI